MTASAIAASLCRQVSFVLLAGLSAVACQSSDRYSDRYLVIANSMDAMGISGLNLCFAIEPNNPQGVWWWHAGRSGCSNRSSGLMPGYRAKVTRQASGTIEASFQVPMKSGVPRQVDLVFSAGTVRASTTGATVGIERRRDLDVPERF
jgi:hypothetical protein